MPLADVNSRAAWPVEPLARLTLGPGSYGSPAAARPFDPSLPRYVRITDIDASGRLDPTSRASITHNAAAPFMLAEGDLLIARSGATVGKSYLYQPADGPCAHAGYVIRFRIDSTKADARFLSHVTQSQHYWRWVNRTLRQGAQPNINAEEYGTLPVVCPPLPEQRRIAEILDAADEAVTAIEAIIAKLRSGRTALIAALVPDQAAGVGRRSNLLAELVQRAEYGISSALADVGTVPVLRMMNLRGGGIDLADLKYSSLPEAQALLLQPWDILFNRTNSLEHVGRTSLWRGELPRASFASYCVRFVAKADKVLPAYLVHYMNVPAVQIRIKRLATPAVQQANINPTQLQQRLPVVYPEEMRVQQRAVDALDAADARIRAEEVCLSKFKLQKQGLMQDLLTGRIRVRV
jgi:type I restriction enzyme, S subunit